MTLISLLLTIVSLAAAWMVYKKMGHEGWEGIIPFYNTFLLCEDLYGNGWKMLLVLIPLYNIYFAIKLYIDFAHRFNKSTGFGVGMLFLPFIFLAMLGFGDAQYGDGSMANTEDDFVSNIVSATASKTKDFAASKDESGQAMKKLEQLNDLKEKGILTEEEYAAKKEELLKKI